MNTNETQFWLVRFILFNYTMVTPKNILIQDLELADKEIKRLREENRKLKEKLSEITMVADDEKQSIEHILELEEENKKLKERVNQLEERLDNKEKVNKQLREDIGKLVMKQ